MSRLIELYAGMAAEAEARAAEDWFRIDRLPASGPNHERSKFQASVPTEVADRFRNYKIGGIGLEHHDYEMSYADWSAMPEFTPLVDDPVVRDEPAEWQLLAIAREHLSTAAPEESRAFLHALDDSLDIGGRKLIIRLNHRLVVCSKFSLKMAERAARMVAVLRRYDVRPSVVLEIGGGYGKTFSDACALLGARTGIYVDLPLNLLCAASYLSKVSTGRLNLVWSADAELRQGVINLVAPWLLESKLTMPVDLALNFLSLQHMQAETQEFYLGTLARRGLGHLYHENRLNPRDRIEGALAGSATLKAARNVDSQVIVRPKFFSPDGREVDPNRDLAVYGQLLQFA